MRPARPAFLLGKTYRPMRECYTCRPMRESCTLENRIRIASGLSAVGLTAILLMAGCTGGSMGSGTGVPPLGTVSPASGTSAYIQHVVIVVQENRSFDDFFATFPGADGAAGGCMEPRSGLVLRSETTSHGCPSGDTYIQLEVCSSRLFELGDTSTYSFVQEYDKGKMDGFNDVAARAQERHERAGRHVCLPVRRSKRTSRSIGPSRTNTFWAIICSRPKAATASQPIKTSSPRGRRSATKATT